MSLLINCLLMLASCIGNTEFWVIVTNRVYSLPVNSRILRRLRTLNDLGIVLYPILLVGLAGLGSNGLLRGGSPFELPLSAQLLLVIPLPMTIVWAASVLRWQTFQKRCFTTADSRERHDFAAIADRNSIRGTGAGVLELWPMNEVYQLEVNRKTVDLTSGAAPAGDRCLKIVLRVAWDFDGLAIVSMHYCPTNHRLHEGRHLHWKTGWNYCVENMMRNAG